MYRIVVPLCEVPDGGIVTKVHGAKKHTVRRVLRVYGIDNMPLLPPIKCEEGCAFLVQENGDANAMSGHKDVIWHADEDDLQHLLNPPEDK
jgi:hypothetical protein